MCTGWGHRMAHRKLKDTKQKPSMLPGPAVPGCCLVSFHFLCAILHTVEDTLKICLEMQSNYHPERVKMPFSRPDSPELNHFSPRYPWTELHCSYLSPSCWWYTKWCKGELIVCVYQCLMTFLCDPLRWFFLPYPANLLGFSYMLFVTSLTTSYLSINLENKRI